MGRLGTTGLLFCLMTAAVGAQTMPDALIRARQAFNDQRLDDAVTLASAARTVAGTKDQAALVLSRALLERFRRSGDVADLALARQAVRDAMAASADRWTPTERHELELAMAELLFADEHFGAAGAVFEAVLDQMSDGADRDRVFEWWALSLDHHAQRGLEEERARRYTRLQTRVDLELRRRPSASALYWQAAAARGVGDVELAWALARATWVRASLLVSGEALVSLRADLDRLVRDAIIPERARATPLGAAAETQATLLAEWTAFKTTWGGSLLP